MIDSFFSRLFPLSAFSTLVITSLELAQMIDSFFLLSGAGCASRPSRSCQCYRTAHVRMILCVLQRGLGRKALALHHPTLPLRHFLARARQSQSGGTCLACYPSLISLKHTGRQPRRCLTSHHHLQALLSQRQPLRPLVPRCNSAGNTSTDGAFSPAQHVSTVGKLTGAIGD
jgi:hypothetical protein